MATLLELQRAANQLNKRAIVDAIFTTVKEVENEIIEKNREQLSNDKTDIYEKAIGYYSRATEKITGGRKKAGTPFTLYDTGDFYRGFYLRIQNNVASVYSRDSKTKSLVDAHKDQFSTFLSGEFFGLTDENLREVIEKSILPLFISAIRGKLGI